MVTVCISEIYIYKSRISIYVRVRKEKERKNAYNAKENICQVNKRIKEEKIHILISIFGVICHYLTIMTLSYFSSVYWLNTIKHNFLVCNTIRMVINASCTLSLLPTF
jgi:NADH:ubiquinone oxidoreductase subunit C